MTYVVRDLKLPVENSDATNKAYVSNYSNWKNSVKVATTENILLSGIQTIDEVLTEIGDRILVKNQTDDIQNGVYIISSTNWERSLDMPINFGISSCVVTVNQGTINNFKTFVCLNNKGSDIIGIDSILWKDFGVNVHNAYGNITAVYNSTYLCDTISSEGPFSITLPDSSVTPIGSFVKIYDAAGNFSIDGVTILSSGSDYIYEPGVVFGVNSLLLGKRYLSIICTLVENEKWVLDSIVIDSYDIYDNSTLALVNRTYMFNTGSVEGPVDITLPDSVFTPIGSVVKIIDKSGTFSNNPLTILSSGADNIFEPCAIEGVNSIIIKKKYITLICTLVASEKWLLDTIVVESINVFSNTTALIERSYICDTSEGSFNITLPPSNETPIGSVVKIYDKIGNFSLSPLILYPDGTDRIVVPNENLIASIVLSTSYSGHELKLIAPTIWLLSSTQQLTPKYGVVDVGDINVSSGNVPYSGYITSAVYSVNRLTVTWPALGTKNVNVSITVQSNSVFDNNYTILPLMLEGSPTTTDVSY